MTKNITTISFDGDATLWKFEKVMRHSLNITLNEIRNRIPRLTSVNLTVEKMIDIRNSAAEELKGKTVNLEKIRLHAFKRTLESIGSTDYSFAAELNALYQKHRFEDIQLYPDVIPILDGLQHDFSIGLLSNGNSYPERCGLADRFSFVTFSQDVLVEKPDPEIFYAACKQANCVPTELMHVGDSLESDVAGANATGVISVWLNRHSVRNNTNITPMFEIQSLSELTEIIKE